MAWARKSWTRKALAMIAGLAVFAQFGLGQAAMAQPAPATIEICTSHGVQKITVDAAPGQPAPAPCNHCDQCLAPALAPIPTQSFLAQPVRYDVAPVRHAPAAVVSAYLARGPPRPPGQGPPVLLNI